MKQPKVSVIIPVYRAEPYIEQCARALFDQTLDDMEFIFIDDCGRDRSMEILEEVLAEYPIRRQQTSIIRHQQNRGVSHSRQDGVDSAHGEYIIHCDPDDWMEREMYEKLYNKARDSNADMVLCDFDEGDSGNFVERIQYIPETKYDILQNICTSEFHTSLCNKLISREYIAKTGVRFDERISLWEDMTYLIPLLMGEGKFIKLDAILYHYRVVADSISHRRTQREIESTLVAADAISTYLSKIQRDREFEKIINLFKIKAKEAYLKNGNFNPRLWRLTFPDSHKKFFSFPISKGRKILYLSCMLHLDFVARLLMKQRKN